MKLPIVSRCLDAILCSALVVLLTSCVSYQRIPTSGKAVEENSLLKAYVSKASEHRAEYKILRYANWYDIVTDSSQADLHIELRPLQAIPAGCVTPQFTVSFLSLGFYPVKFVQGYVFEYSELDQGERIDYREQIEIISRMSWFHLFSLRKSRKKAIGKSLQLTDRARK